LRVACFAFAALFLLGAVVQWNDPDPALWMLAYTVAAALSLAAGSGRVLFVGHLGAAIVFGVAFASIASTLIGAPAEAFTSFEMQAAAHEAPREAAGLALLAVWNGVLALRARRLGDAVDRESASSRGSY